MKLENEDDPYSMYKCIEPLTDEQTEYFNKLPTMIDLLNYSVDKFGDYHCQGTRLVYSEDEEVQPNGKIFKKVRLPIVVDLR